MDQRRHEVLALSHLPHDVPLLAEQDLRGLRLVDLPLDVAADVLHALNELPRALLEFLRVVPASIDNLLDEKEVGVEEVDGWSRHVLEDVVVDGQQVPGVVGCFFYLGEVVEEIEDEVLVHIAAGRTLDDRHAHLEGKIDDVWVNVDRVEE